MRTSAPLVSVILPNFNYARYLRERIQSILNQSMDDYELLYIDDCSSDLSNTIVKEFLDDPRITTVFHDQNSGRVYRRWNEGAAMAKGQWLWFAGADDAAEPDFLEELTRIASSQSNIAIAHCQTMRIDDVGRILEHRWGGDLEVMQHLNSSRVTDGEVEIGMLTGGCFMASASSMLIRREVFDRLGGFDDRLRQSADWNFYVKACEGSKIAYVNSPLSSYRIHAGAVTSSTKITIKLLEDYYAVASAWKWVRSSSVVSPAVRTLVERRLQAKAFDYFAAGDREIPRELDFIVQDLSSWLPDKRWANLLSNQKREQK